MATKSSVDDRLRAEVKAERTRRGWSQDELAKLLSDRYALAVYGSTIAKIEAGNRPVRVVELAALSDVFGVSVETLLGRGRGADTMWAASKLSTNAQKTAIELRQLHDRAVEDARDLTIHSAREGKFEQLRHLSDAAMCAAEEIERARARVAELASEWPMPGVSFDR